VSDEHLYLFNDPYCPSDVGEYTWKSEGGDLRIDVIADLCSFGLRGENFSTQPWRYCGSADETKSVNSDQPLPPGCVKNPAPEITGVIPNLPFEVVVHPGYSRNFAVQPDIYAAANSEGKLPPTGILITHSDVSISYGLNRVLWGEGDWVQASTDMEFASMGVQIYGDHIIGWARVLFDNEEVWRGNTAGIWSDKGLYGGYIEISGFDPGLHTIRVESMGFDYHPVTVAYFGFGYHGGVEIGE
jgi:hypothetical protein